MSWKINFLAHGKVPRSQISSRHLIDEVSKLIIGSNNIIHVSFNIKRKFSSRQTIILRQFLFTINEVNKTFYCDACIICQQVKLFQSQSIH